MKMKWAILSAGTASALLVAAALSFTNSTTAIAQGAPQRQGPPPAKVSVATAITTAMAPTVEMPGTVISPADSRVAAAISGTVTWIADVGTAVEAGDVIARIDDRDWTLELADREAEIARLEARQGFMTRDLARFEELASSGNSPAQRLDQARMDLATTKAELDRARVALSRTRVNLTRAEVRAPFPGRVVERLAAQGEFASPGRELVRLVDTYHLEVRAQIPVALASALDVGAEVTVTDKDGGVAAPVRTIVPVGNEVSRTVELRVTAPEGRWVVGTPVRVSIPTASVREVVAVPRDALVLRPGAVFIYAVADDNTARRIDVTTGTARGDLIEVVGDVQAGEKIIIRGGERLRPGQTVELTGAVGSTIAAAGR